MKKLLAMIALTLVFVACNTQVTEDDDSTFLNAILEDSNTEDEIVGGFDDENEEESIPYSEGPSEPPVTDEE